MCLGCQQLLLLQHILMTVIKFQGEEECVGSCRHVSRSTSPWFGKWGYQVSQFLPPVVESRATLGLSQSFAKQSPDDKIKHPLSLNSSCTSAERAQHPGENCCLAVESYLTLL